MFIIDHDSWSYWRKTLFQWPITFRSLVFRSPSASPLMKFEMECQKKNEEEIYLLTDWLVFMYFLLFTKLRWYYKKINITILFFSTLFFFSLSMPLRINIFPFKSFQPFLLNSISLFFISPFHLSSCDDIYLSLTHLLNDGHELRNTTIPVN